MTVYPHRAPLIVGIGGTTRSGSSSETALRIALRAAAAQGARTELLSGRALDLPHYDPEDPHRTLAALRLIELLRQADGVILASPAYHGGMSGMLKNALDYTEDMRGDARVYLDGRPVGIIVAAYGAQAMGTTLSGIRSVVHALRGWPTPMAVAINGLERPFDGGEPREPALADQLDMLARQVVQGARVLGALSESEQRLPRAAANG